MPPRLMGSRLQGRSEPTPACAASFKCLAHYVFFASESESVVHRLHRGCLGAQHGAVTWGGVCMGSVVQAAGQKDTTALWTLCFCALCTHAVYFRGISPERTRPGGYSEGVTSHLAASLCRRPRAAN